MSFTPERTIERPEVASWIAQCITCWSWVETQTSRLFSLLLGLNIEAGVELYNSFGGASLKENAIKVLARSKLAPAHYQLIDALLKVINSHQKTRDKIAHWYWGISDQIQDGLVLVDPKDILIRDARIADKQLRSEQLTADDYRITLEHIYIYRVRDLQADAKTFIELAALVNKCHGLCRLTGNRLWQLRDELSRDARLVERLNPSSSAGQ
ncbi:MAG TPA: hypothetical protein VKV77_11230 [Methylovirgula sp.]|nr:hypothetical protein [Methylovirgula sp.]